MPKQKHGYIQRVDAVRALLMAALILSVYRLPLRFMRYFSLLCGFAPCALFALYGYFVLRPHDGRFTLKKNILNTLITFLILLAAFVVVGSFYQWLNCGRAFSWLNVPNLLTFLLFNKWPINLGESIWLIQSVLYALLIFALFRKCAGKRTLDLIVCGALLLLGVVFGELAGILHMPFYMERNFLLTTIPYMLLGKLLRDAPEKIKKMSGRNLLVLFAVGVVLCAVEALILRRCGTLDSCDNLIGYIPITAAVVLFAVRGPEKTRIGTTDIRLMTVYRFVYYFYNPVAELYFMATIFLIGFPKLFNIAAGATVLVTIVLSFVLAKLVANSRTEDAW